MAAGPEGDLPVTVPAPPAANPASGRLAINRGLRYVALAVKLALFALVFAFAVKNSEPVVLKFFLGRELAISLALALVAALCTGAVLGVLAMAGYTFRLRREAAQARREADAASRALAAVRAVPLSGPAVGVPAAPASTGSEWPLNHGL